MGFVREIVGGILGEEMFDCFYGELVAGESAEYGNTAALVLFLKVEAGIKVGKVLCIGVFYTQSFV